MKPDVEVWRRQHEALCTTCEKWKACLAPESCRQSEPSKRSWFWSDAAITAILIGMILALLFGVLQ